MSQKKHTAFADTISDVSTESEMNSPDSPVPSLPPEKKKKLTFEEKMKLARYDLSVRGVMIFIIALIGVLIAGPDHLVTFSAAQMNNIGAVALVVFSAMVAAAMIHFLLRDLRLHPSEQTSEAKKHQSKFLTNGSMYAKKIATDLTFWNFNTYVGLATVSILARNIPALKYTVCGLFASAFLNAWVRGEKSRYAKLSKKLIILLYTICCLTWFFFIYLTIDHFLPH